MKNIEAIIFDLGGVILNLRYENTIEAFTQLCGRDVSQLYSQQKQSPIFDEIETGKISPKEFRLGLRNILNIHHLDISDEQLDFAWNAMLLDIPKERLEFLQKIGKQKRIFLLSNTNEIHKKAFDENLYNEHQMKSLDHLFEKAYYSHLVMDRKPNPSIFEYVLTQNNLKPETTLFIDDSHQHIVGASRVGVQTIHLKSPVTILDLNLL
jgi:putative hydrolase of the HAD superfamily